MAEAPTLIQDEENEVGEGIQNWVVISEKDEEERGRGETLMLRVEPGNGGGETRHSARNQRE